MNTNDVESQDMYVIKRDGSREPVSFDKVLERCRKAATGLTGVNYTRLAQLVLAEIRDGIHTTELDELAARLAISYMTVHPDWATLAAQIILSNCQRSAPATFSVAMEELAALVDVRGNPAPALAADVIAFIRSNATELDAMVRSENDFLLDYFGFKTLEKAYLLRGKTKQIVETPQYMWMRVAVGMWGCSHDGKEIPVAERLKNIQETYTLMSNKAFTHATPTLFNAGTPRPQCSSCFIEGTPVHTMDGVKAIEQVAIGDKVVTHTGAVKKVVQLHKNPISDRKLYSIKIAGSPTITVTENHRLMSLSDEQEGWNHKPTWNRVDYLRVGDWIAIPKKEGGAEYVLDVKTILDDITTDGNKITYLYEYDDTTVYPFRKYMLHKKHAGEVECVKSCAPFNRFWKFDAVTMELLGIWFGDGCITNAKNSTGSRVPRNINIVSYHNNPTLIDFVVPAFKKFLGVDHVTVSHDKHGMVSMIVNHTIISHIFKQLFNCGFDKKRLPAFFNTMTRDHVRAFLTGLVSSDGCVSRKGNVTVCLTNPPLVQDIYHLARSVGIPITLTMMSSASGKPTGRMTIPYEIICGGVKKHYADSRLTTTVQKEWVQSRVIDGTTFLRLNGKEISDEAPEYVYTLGVEDDHSYSVGGIVAENCFLIAMKSDSIEGIFDTLKECAQISKYAGGIGLHVHNIRAQGTAIAGTQGTSNGLVPMLRVFNNTARYVDQGGGKRNGSFAIYLEPWHADIQQFLKMKSNTGSEEERARDLFYALWIPDLFMRRVETGGDWSLFCPHEAPGLADVYGAEFTELYERYEREGRARRTVPAQKLWSEILVSQIETGTPYLLYKDAANMKSNQKNLGTIKSSNLCVAPDTLVEIYDLDPDMPEEWHGIRYPRKKSVHAIADLEDKEVTVWNGEGFSRVIIRKTGESQHLLTVVVRQRTSVGLQCTTDLDCTPYHKFLLHVDDDVPLHECPRVSAEDLRPGMRLCDYHTESGEVVEQEVAFVRDRGLVDDTYCYTEPRNHVGIFNGIMTGQCTEIMEYSSPEETAVCNLASIALPFFVKPDNTFDFDLLMIVTDRIVRNLNRVIDINFYPTPETRRSNMRHRPIGLGVQGLADVFARLGLAWETPEAAALNQEIFETIYYAALQASAALAEKDGPYETYIGSPASKGQLQPDLWGIAPADYKTAKTLDWERLHFTVAAAGLRNSLLVAPMPTASTSQILGYNECIEPFTTNIYVRRTLAGEFTVINKYLVADLMMAGLWSPELKDRIVAANGSVQGLPEVPADIKARYKTVWEIKQKTLIDMAADRGAFICQSQSLNLFVADPTIAKLSSMHFYAWKRGLKTGIYYLRTKSAVQAIKFTLDPRLAAGGSSARLAEVAASVGAAVGGAGASSSSELQECLLCSS